MSIKDALATTGVTHDAGVSSLSSANDDSPYGRGGQWDKRRRSPLDAYNDTEEKFGASWQSRTYGEESSVRGRKYSDPISTIEESQSLLGTGGGGDGEDHPNSEPLEVAKESDADYKSRWNSIRVMYLTTFLSSVGFSIVLSTLWPYLQSLGGTKTFLGWIVSSYSLGQLIGSPVFGVWSNYRPYMEPLIITLFFTIGGNVMYCFAGSFNGSNAEYFMLVARILVGLGAGNVAVCRAYVATATRVTERTAAMANMSAAQGLGFIVGPAMGSAFTSLKPGIHSGPFVLDFLTGPGWISAVLGLINLICVFVFFREHKIAQLEGGESKQETELSPEAKAYDKFAALSSLIIFTIILFVFSVYETIGTPLTGDEYGWTGQQQDLFNGILYGVSGILAVFVFMGIKPASRKWGERPLLIWGLFFCFLGFVVYLPFGPGHMACHSPIVTNQTNISSEAYALYVPLSPLTVALGDANSNTSEPHWCETQPLLPLGQFIAGSALIGIGYPMSSVMMFSIYSKVLGPAPQGFGMGLLTACGSGARTIGPIFVTAIYDAFGPRDTFAFIGLLMLLSIIYTFVVYKWLIPHTLWRTPEEHERLTGKKPLTDFSKGNIQDGMLDTTGASHI